MKICLISPAHLSANPRLVKEADALAEVGHDVVVIAGAYSPWGMEADKAFASRPWRVLGPVFFGPHAPRTTRLKQLARHHGARMLARAGARHASVVHAAWRPIAPDLAAAARRVRADLYIAHYPAALPAAAMAAQAHGALYAYDAEDFHPGDPPDDARFDHQRALTDAIERRRLAGCAYVTAASPGIADAYAAAYGVERPTVVLNVFARAHAPNRFTASGWAEPAPSIYWFSQTVGADRGLEAAVAAIGLARSQPHLFLRGAPSPGFADTLQNMASRCGAAGRLHLLPPGPPEEMTILAAPYDLGLVSETGHTLNRRIALTNKLFTYLLAGVPAVISDIEAHRRVAADAGASVVLYRQDDPNSLADALDRLLGDPARLSAAREAAFRLGQTRFNWEMEKKTLLDCVARALGGDGAET